MAARAARLVVADDRYSADLAEVEEFAESLPEKWLLCRELGHNWRPRSVGRTPDGDLERSLKCARCPTKRVQTLSSVGMILSNRYIYPEGYQHKGLGPIIGEARGKLRIVSILRTFKDIESE